jgi:hypothetical protein
VALVFEPGFEAGCLFFEKSGSGNAAKVKTQAGSLCFDERGMFMGCGVQDPKVANPPLNVKSRVLKQIRPGVFQVLTIS